MPVSLPHALSRLPSALRTTASPALWSQAHLGLCQSPPPGPSSILFSTGTRGPLPLDGLCRSLRLPASRAFDISQPFPEVFSWCLPWPLSGLLHTLSLHSPQPSAPKSLVSTGPRHLLSQVPAASPALDSTVSCLSTSCFCKGTFTGIG